MILKPHYNLKSIFDINLNELKEKGIKAILFDLDSTLVQSKTGVYRQEVKDWLEVVKRDFKIAIISNNTKPDYLNKVQSASDFPVIGYAHKPSIKKMVEFITPLNIKPEETAVVGDRPLTDIWAGLKLGGIAILVDSISADIEPKSTRFVRWLERLTIKNN